VTNSIKVAGPASGIRGHDLRLSRESTAFNPRHNFFLNRVAPSWNKLNSETVHAVSVNSFKARI